MKDLNPPAIVRPAEDLATLAHAINAEHSAGEAAARKGLAHFRAAGEKLLKAKAQCGHGKWLPWLAKNVHFDRRTATNYMRLADIPADKWETVSHLPMREALCPLVESPPADPLETTRDVLLLKCRHEGSLYFMVLRAADEDAISQLEACQDEKTRYDHAIDELIEAGRLRRDHDADAHLAAMFTSWPPPKKHRWWRRALFQNAADDEDGCEDELFGLDEEE